MESKKNEIYNTHVPCMQMWDKQTYKPLNPSHLIILSAAG